RGHDRRPHPVRVGPHCLGDRMGIRRKQQQPAPGWSREDRRPRLLRGGNHLRRIGDAEQFLLERRPVRLTPTRATVSEEGCDVRWRSATSPSSPTCATWLEKQPPPSSLHHSTGSPKPWAKPPDGSSRPSGPCLTPPPWWTCLTPAISGCTTCSSVWRCSSCSSSSVCT